MRLKWLRGRVDEDDGESDGETAALRESLQVTWTGISSKFSPYLYYICSNWATRAVQQRAWCQQAATQDTVLAAVGPVVGQFSLKCLAGWTFGHVLNKKLCAGQEKEKNEGVGKKVDLEARMEAAEAVHRLLWSKPACNSIKISPPYIFIVLHVLFS